MVQTLVLTHGNLARELLATAERISGEIPNIQALSLDWNAPREGLLEDLRRAVEDLDQGEGVLVLTDLFGDTPSNLALTLVRKGEVEVVTGVNLPMVLRISCLGDRPMKVGQLARWIQQKGKQGIRRGAASTEGRK